MLLAHSGLLTAGGDFGELHSDRMMKAKQVIDNKTDSKIRVTVKQFFPCRNRTWVVEPQKKKEIWLRTGCFPKSISISSYPKAGWLKFETNGDVSEQPEFPISQRTTHREGLIGRINETWSTQWTLTIGPRRVVPVDAPIPIEAKH